MEGIRAIRFTYLKSDDLNTKLQNELIKSIKTNQQQTTSSPKDFLKLN